ncbi:sugar transferase [Turicibacter sanguinis]|uniref:sugar transferase n=1 Tax=Turicibacter sanguinis TaxID=154288 RepID=UPI0018981CDF|nr:sugar transferase [Turicibacter sanguinis]MDB8555538.1 sugar transferase [Turicibacter sanguinis]
MYIKIKQFIDYFMAILLLVILSPIILIACIAIKIESPSGPILFKQERLGKDGRIFEVYKFRTMIPNAINIGTGIRTQLGDSRITKVGNFMRKTSIDEIPQLFNILRGEMSFVGPRPPLTYHPYKYEEYSQEQQLRFIIKPGITGLAQMKYRNSVPWENRIVEDVKYAQNVSLKLDIQIIFGTIYTVLLGKNIYPTVVAEDMKSEVV